MVFLVMIGLIFETSWLSYLALILLGPYFRSDKIRINRRLLNRAALNGYFNELIPHES